MHFTRCLAFRFLTVLMAVGHYEISIVCITPPARDGQTRPRSIPHQLPMPRV